ncbi:MAG: isoprenylcysteine carboxylmethyltransferase family protein [Candidatus Tectomicrobia bacterium]|nr:isoprenylcysteine carboxylmethyltransferase family protein [Candidatus Tectomicrobia bacterium]
MVDVQDQGHAYEQFNRRRVIGVLLCLPLFFYVCFFLPAGTFAWHRGWLFILVFLTLETILARYLWRTNPELLIARSHFHKGTKRWDKVLIAFLIPAFIAIFPIAAFDDGRFHWSEMSGWLCGLGYLLMLGGFGLASWAGRVNKFAEPTVRIQTDRGHQVIDSGPYAIIRHPMYTACLGIFPGFALALGSYWALLPAWIGCGILVLRTQWEDQTLQAELHGYLDYTVRVPFKLIPYLW